MRLGLTDARQHLRESGSRAPPLPDCRRPGDAAGTEATHALRHAAANAIVGLEQEFDPVPGETVHGFRCETADGRYTTRDLTAGVLRIYRRCETI